MSAQHVVEPAELEAKVTVLAWPAREPERRRLAAAGEPRILVVSPTDPPPTVADELEDWVREPVDLVELAVRSTTLRARHRTRRRPPTLEPGGILRHRGRWVAVSPAQLPLVGCLLANLGCVVRTAELRHVHAAAGGVDDALAVAAVLRRLAPSLADLGLDLHRLRDRGYLLDWAERVESVERVELDAAGPRVSGVAAATGHRRPSGRRVIGDRTSVKGLAWVRGRGRDR